MNNIIIAKLVTGETVVGNWMEGYVCDLTHAYQIVMHPTARGEMNMALMPYLAPFTDKGSVIKREFIVASIPCPEEIEREYIKATTGLIIPKII